MTLLCSVTHSKYSRTWEIDFMCLEKSWATYQWREDESYDSRRSDQVTNHSGRTEYREGWQVPIFRKLSYPKPIRKWRCRSGHTSKVGQSFICISASTAHLEVQYNNDWCKTTSVLVHCSPNRDLYQRNMENCQQNQKMIDVFHRRCLRSIVGISWRDHVTNDEVMARTGQAALHDTVATRRRRLFFGHILRLPTTRPASLAIMWRPEGGRRRVVRPKRTWQDTLKEDLNTLGVDANDARDTANDRARWRQLVTPVACHIPTSYLLPT